MNPYSYEDLSPDERVHFKRMRDGRFRWVLYVRVNRHGWLAVADGIERTRGSALISAIDRLKEIT